MVKSQGEGPHTDAETNGGYVSSSEGTQIPIT